MNVFSVPYRIVFGGANLVPLCGVWLLGPRKKILVQSIVDSGADYPIFPLKAAEDATIDPFKGSTYPIQYGGGRTPGRLVRVQVMIGERRLDVDVVFVERLEFPYALLGRITLFAQFREVAFIEKTDPPRVEFRW